MNPSDLKQKLRDAILPETIAVSPYETRFHNTVRAISERLDRVLDGAMVMTGFHNTNLTGDTSVFRSYVGTRDTHQALLLMIEPLTPPDQRVTKEEIVEALKKEHYKGHGYSGELADRIEKFGIKGE